MSFFSKLKAKFFKEDLPTPPEPKLNLELFIYIKIPDPVGPLDRAEKYEDRLEPLLAAESLGTISGGGSSLGHPRPDGIRPIEYCGIDVDVTDLERARKLLRDWLPGFGAPVGTEIQFTLGGMKLQDTLTAGGWLLNQPRTFLHPGFDV